MDDPTPHVASLLNLEPIGTAGLAICLAYLALERFRYRSAIEAVASDRYKQFADDEMLQRDESLDSLNELRWLCRKPCFNHEPSGIFATIYKLVYRRQFDIGLVGFLTLMCAITLISGAAKEVDFAWFQTWTKNATVVTAFFWFCVLAMVIPTASIFLGRKCVSWGHERAEHQERQVNNTLQYRAAGAKIAPEATAPAAPEIVPTKPVSKLPIRRTLGPTR